ncbi:hypothetical protein OCA23_30285 [Bacillus cereus]|nr:hypothetical protein [Bacillus cereus]
MLPNYKQDILNGQAFKALNKPLHMPKHNLNVADAEYMGNYKMRVHHENKMPRLITPSPASMPFEQVHHDLQNETVKQEDFPQSEWFGSPIASI